MDGRVGFAGQLGRSTVSARQLAHPSAVENQRCAGGIDAISRTKAAISPRL
jgi:hypothetical protein